MNDIDRFSGVDKEIQNTNSPEKGEPVFLAVGKLRHAHGVNGEITMDIYTDFPERLRPGKKVYVGERHQPLRISAKRKKNKFLLLSFDGFQDCDQINVFRNEIVYIIAEKLPSLPDGQYYHHELLGLTVVDPDNSIMGSLAEIIETGANDVYVVKAEDGSETLLPAIAEVIIKVDLENRQMTVRPLEWA